MEKKLFKKMWLVLCGLMMMFGGVANAQYSVLSGGTLQARYITGTTLSYSTYYIQNGSTKPYFRNYNGCNGGPGNNILIGQADSPTEGVITAGDWIQYPISLTEANAGIYTITLQIAKPGADCSGTCAKTIDLLLDGVVVGDDVDVPGPCSAGNWNGLGPNTKVSITGVQLPAGSHNLRLLFNNNKISFYQFEFTKTGSLCATTKPTLNGTTICAGANLSTLVSSTPGTGETYYWQTASGGTSTSNNPTTAALGTSYYLRSYNGTCWGEATAAVSVTTTAITTQPQDVAVPQGGAATLTVAAAGVSLTYQWYQVADPSGNPGENDTPVGTGTTYSPSTATIGIIGYYVVVTGSCGSAVESDVAFVEVLDPTLIDQDAAYICSDYLNADVPAGYSILSVGRNTYLFDDGNTSGNSGQGILQQGGTSYNAANARWTITSTESPFYTFQNVATGRYWTTANDKYWGYRDAQNWNAVQLSTSAGTLAYFTYENKGGGNYSMRANQWDTNHYLTTRYIGNLSQDNGGGAGWVLNNGVVCGNYYNDNYDKFTVVLRNAIYFPDIVINSITPDSDNVALGSPITGTMELANTGAASVASGTSIRIKISFGIQYFYFNYTLTSDLVSSGTVEVPFSFTPSYATTEQGATLTMTANSQYAIAETNPCNNTLSTDNEIVVTSSCEPILDTFTVKWTEGAIGFDCSTKMGNIDVPEVASSGSLTQLETYFTTSQSGYTVWLNDTQLGLGTDMQGKASTYYDYGQFQFNGTVYVKDAANNVVETYLLSIAGTRGVGTGTGETPADVVQTEYFTLTGIKLAKRPASGIVIVKEILRNGDVNVKKAIIQ